MQVLTGFVVELLRLVPLILAFYVPALIGVVFLKERGEIYLVKSALVFLVGFGGIIAVRLLLRSASTLQDIQTIGLSLLEIAVALFFAVLTVYKLAD